jgi:hypothetical protein
MNDPSARNTGQHQCIANDVPCIPPSILRIYLFCVQPAFVYRLCSRLILRRTGIQRLQELVRAGGCGNRVFHHDVLCGNLFPIQNIDVLPFSIPSLSAVVAAETSYPNGGDAVSLGETDTKTSQLPTTASPPSRVIYANVVSSECLL